MFVENTVLLLGPTVGNNVESDDDVGDVIGMLMSTTGLALLRASSLSDASVRIEFPIVPSMFSDRNDPTDAGNGVDDIFSFRGVLYSVV